MRGGIWNLVRRTLIPGAAPADPIFDSVEGGSAPRMRFVFGAARSDRRLLKSELPRRGRRHVALVLDHQPLAKVDLGNTVTQGAALSGDPDAATLCYLQVERHISEVLKRVPLGYLGVPFVADLYRAVVYPENTLLLSRAAANLLNRGCKDVSLVLTDYSPYHASLVYEAIRCGLADDEVLLKRGSPPALAPQKGFAEGDRTSTPTDWLARFQEGLELRVAEEPCPVAVVCALSGGAAATAEAMKALLAREPGTIVFTAEESFAQALAEHDVPATALHAGRGLRARNPKELVEAVEGFIRAFEADVAARTWDDEEEPWRGFGRHSLHAFDRTLFRVEQSINWLLEHAMLIDHLDALVSSVRPTRIYKFPDSRNAFDGSLYYLSRKYDVPGPIMIGLGGSAQSMVDSSSSLVSRAGDPVARAESAPVIPEFETAQPTIQHATPELDEFLHQDNRDKVLRLVMNVKPEDADLVKSLIERAVSHHVETVGGDPPRVATLLVEYQGLMGIDFGGDQFTELELIKTNSDPEEDIYREVDEHELELVSRLKRQYLGVPLAADIYRGVVPSPERFIHLARAARMLFEKGYRYVFVLLSDFSYHHGALFLEAGRCGIMSSATPAAVVGNGMIQTSSKPTDRSRSTTREDWLKRFTPVLRPKRSDRCRVLVLTPSIAPHFLRNGLEVVRHLQDAGVATAVFTIWESQAQVLRQQHGIAARAVDIEVGSRARDPKGIVAAVEGFIEEWERDAETRAWAGETGDWRLFGQNTLNAYDRLVGQFEDTVTLLLRHCILIDRLDAMMTEMKPSAIYKFPSGGTYCDGALYFLCRKHGIPLVSSVFLSITESHRNMDRTPHDVLTTLGDEQTELLRTCIEAREIIPVGQPEMDALARDWPLEKSRPHVREKLPAAAGKRHLIVVATSAFDIEGEMKWIVELARHARERGDAYVVVKLHPATMPSRYVQLAARHPDLPLAAVVDDVVAPYLQCASVVLTDLSHAGKMTIYLDRPLLVVNMTGSELPYNRYNEQDVALIARTDQEMRDQVDRVLDQGVTFQGRPTFIARQFTSDDSRATERIVDILMRECARYEATRKRERGVAAMFKAAVDRASFRF